MPIAQPSRVQQALHTAGPLIDSLETMQQVRADVPTLLLDATERPYRRAQTVAN